jgi:hypothetical protein
MSLLLLFHGGAAVVFPPPSGEGLVRIGVRERFATQLVITPRAVVRLRLRRRDRVT